MKHLFTAIILLCAPALLAQDFPWQFGGQVQIRTELDGRDFLFKTYMPYSTSLRARLNAAKKFDDRSEFFFQAQDSRMFGSEVSTVDNSRNLDIHQAFVKLQNPFGMGFGLQAGRFEMAYGSERFIGAVGWHYVGRAFDGMRLSFKLAPMDLDIFAVTLSDISPYISNVTPTTFSYPEKSDVGSSLYGFWMNLPLNVSHSFDFFSYYELNRKQTNGSDYDAQVVTLGLNHSWKYEIYSALIEAAYQNGMRGNKTVHAWLASASAYIKQEQMRLGAGFDFLSGTPDPSKQNNTFSVAFGTNHKFYGYMDYFIDIPRNTSQLGLMDLYMMIELFPRNARFNASLNLHHFASQLRAANSHRIFGQEADLTVRYLFSKNVTITFGGSVFFPGDLMRDFFTVGTFVRDDPSTWAYAMLTANF